MDRHTRKKVARELVKLAKELTAQKREASSYDFSWTQTYSDGSGRYVCFIDSGLDAESFEKIFKKAASEMFRRLEKAGLEWDTVEEVDVMRGSIVIIQDEVIGPVSKEQINILTR
jgi:hypothetical protein